MIKATYNPITGVRYTFVDEQPVSGNHMNADSVQQKMTNTRQITARRLNNRIKTK